MMLEFLQDGRATTRKLQLSACACCREVWHLLGVRQYRKVVLVAERYADVLATEQALEKARRDAYYAPAKESSLATRAAQIAASSLTWLHAARSVVQYVQEA